jgi:hypothetical protein
MWVFNGFFSSPLFSSTFIWKHIDAQLSERQVNFFTRILLLSALDAASIGIFLSAFETCVFYGNFWFFAFRVQLNPAITIAQLFSMNTPWYLCILLICIQFLGGFAGILLFYVSILIIFIFMLFSLFIPECFPPCRHWLSTSTVILQAAFLNW